MATLGQLIIAVKTSGVEEARKQLEALDAFASSIGSKAGASAQSNAGAGVDERTAALRADMEEELRITGRIADIERSRVDMLNREAEGVARVTAEREKQLRMARESSATTAARERGETSGRSEGQTSSQAEDAGEKAGGLFSNAFLKRTVGAMVAMRGIETAAMAVAAGLEGGVKGGAAGAARGVIGALPGGGAGLAIGDIIAGNTQMKTVEGLQERLNALVIKGNSYRQTSFETAKQTAAEEYRAAQVNLELERRRGEISDENYTILSAQLDQTFSREQRNIDFQKNQRTRGFRAEEESTGSQIFGAAIAFEKGQLAGQIDQLRQVRDAKIASLEIDKQAATESKDQEKIDHLNVQISQQRSLFDVQKTVLEQENAREVQRQTDIVSARTSAVSMISDNASNEAMNVAQAKEKIAELSANAAKSDQEDVDALTHQASMAAHLAVEEAKKMESRRQNLLLEQESMALQIQGARIAAERGETARGGASFDADQRAALASAMHRKDESAEIRDQAAIADRKAENEIRSAQERVALEVKLKEIERQGGPKVNEKMEAARDEFKAREEARAADLAHAKDRAANNANIRAIELNEEKDFMRAKTRILAEANTGTVPELFTRIKEMRERAREEAIRNPLMANEIQAQEKEQEKAELRRNLKLKTVTAQQAHFTAFGGAQTSVDIKGKEKYKQQDKANQYLSEIAYYVKYSTARAQ